MKRYRVVGPFGAIASFGRRLEPARAYAKSVGGRVERRASGTWGNKDGKRENRWIEVTENELEVGKLGNGAGDAL